MENIATKVADILTEMAQTPEADPVAAEYGGRAADHLKIAHGILLEGIADVAQRKRVADERAAAEAKPEGAGDAEPATAQ